MKIWRFADERYKNKTWKISLFFQPYFLCTQKWSLDYWKTYLID